MSTGADKVDGAEKIEGILQRSTDIRFFLHVLCFVLHAEVCLSVATGASIPSVQWRTLDELTPAAIVASVASYCLLMAVVFRLAYALLRFSTFHIVGRTWWSAKSKLGMPLPWEAPSGCVALSDLYAYVHATRDYELYRIAEERRAERWRADSRHRELANLFFSACVLLWINSRFAERGFVQQTHAFLEKVPMGEALGRISIMLVVLLTLFIFQEDVFRDRWEDTNFYYPPLAKELAAKKTKDVA